MVTWLTPHFSLEELTVTNQRELNNRPGLQARRRLRALAETLEAVRAALGHRPVVITSGYRSPAVNRAVGGSPTSAHMRGEAADFVCPTFGSPAEICRAIVRAEIGFDQLIEEDGRWVHLAIGGDERGQVLRWRPGRGYLEGLS